MSPTLPHFRSWVKAWTTAALPPELCVQRAPRVPPRVRLFRLLSWFRSSPPPSSTAPSDDREKLSVLSSLSLSTERSGDAPSIARSRPTPAGKVSPRDKFGVEEEALHCARVFAAKVRAVGREVADRDGHNAVVMRRVTYHSLARREEHARGGQ